MAFTLKDPNSDWSAWDYAAHMIGVLQQIADNTHQTDEDNETRRARRGFVLTLDGTGYGVTTLELNPGATLNLLTYSYQVAGAASGYLAFYRDVEEGTSLLLADSIQTIKTDSFNSEGHFLPPSSKLLVVVRNGPAGGTVSGNVSGVQDVARARVTTKAGGEF